MAGPRRAASNDEGKDEGALKGARILVVEGRYYDEIADELLAGAKRALDAAKVGYDVVTVPGALEVPQAIALALDAAAKRKASYAGAVALGCVIRGETSHYDIVAGESARALMDVGIARGVPVGNGILTVDRVTQARVRASREGQDKGGSAARAALALARLARASAPPRGRR
ncbi:MAG TPA: 6,7-dimethyl-8-ribityllumazine synthase [Xanthobacteraceae bacterium]|nr:6,7-dimethyl-8-ribityllumazine synthase [Xanthobacteraceae bacterium]